MDEGKKLPAKPEKDRPPGLISKVKDSLSQLSMKKKEIDDKYDQSVVAIKDWEADQNKKMDAVEEQLKLRYDGTVIDVAQMEQHAEMERNRQNVLNSIKQDWEDVQNFSIKLEKLKQISRLNDIKLPQLMSDILGTYLSNKVVFNTYLEDLE